MIRNRNNILCMAVSLCLLLSLFVYRPPMVSAASGTQNDPILITSAADFDRIRNGLDKHYKIADNVTRITLPAGFRMIAEDDAFTGSLDGNGKTVVIGSLSTNLSPDAALFYQNAGVIKNLTLELTADVSGMMAASIAVYNGSWKHGTASLTQLPGQITGCTVTIGKPLRGMQVSAGIAAQNEAKSSITGCNVLIGASGSIKADGAFGDAGIAGGLVGINRGKLQDCRLNDPSGRITPKPSGSYAPYIGRYLTGTVSSLSTELPTVPVTGVEIAGEATVAAGSHKTVAASVLPSNATDRTIRYTTGNSRIATVDEKGVVTGVAPGKTWLTAQNPSSLKSAKCLVTVVLDGSGTPVTSVTLSSDELTVTAGKTGSIPVTVLPANASDKAIAWSTGNSAIARVDGSGVITGVSPGKTWLYAKNPASGLYAKALIIVESASGGIPVTSVRLNVQEASVKAGKTLAFSAQALPANASDRTIAWSIGNSSIASVSTSGVVTAKSPGKTWLYAKNPSSGLSDKCLLTVEPDASGILVTSVALNTSETSIRLGETRSFSAKLLPQNASDKTIQWSIGNTAIASVSASGVVTPKSVGKTWLYAKNPSSGVSDKCLLTIESNLSGTLAESVTLDSHEVTIQAGKTRKMSVQVLPGDAVDKNIQWSTGNPAVAAVDNTGVITAKKSGSTWLYARNAASGKSDQCLVHIDGSLVVDSVSFGRDEASVAVGKTLKLTAAALPQTAQDRTIVYSSGNPFVAKVAADGTVTGIGKGATWIYAKNPASGKSDKCLLRVQ